MHSPDRSSAHDTSAQPYEKKIRVHLPERFLIVDDNEDVARTLALMLGQFNRTARATLSGAEALRVGANFRPDVVVLDLVMPHLDGFETCRRIRAQDWGAQARIIAFTGWTSEGEYRRAKQAGFDGFLAKPLAASSLQDLLTGAVPV